MEVLVIEHKNTSTMNKYLHSKVVYYLCQQWRYFNHAWRYKFVISPPREAQILLLLTKEAKVEIVDVVEIFSDSYAIAFIYILLTGLNAIL